VCSATYYLFIGIGYGELREHWEICLHAWYMDVFMTGDVI